MCFPAQCLQGICLFQSCKILPPIVINHCAMFWPSNPLIYLVKLDVLEHIFISSPVPVPTHQRSRLCDFNAVLFLVWTQSSNVTFCS